jgi:hypothetical protein
VFGNIHDATYHKYPLRYPYEERNYSYPSGELPIPGFCNGMGKLYGVHLFYGRKGLIIVYPVDLLKTFGNQYFLIPTHLYIFCLLGPIDPSSSDKILV